MSLPASAWYVQDDDDDDAHRGAFLQGAGAFTTVIAEKEVAAADMRSAAVDTAALLAGALASSRYMRYCDDAVAVGEGGRMC